jgi:hypothetical protein
LASAKPMIDPNHISPPQTVARIVREATEKE